MLTALLLGGAWIVMQRYFNEGSVDLVSGRENLGRMSNPSTAEQRAPHLLRDDIQEKSFWANQSHNTVRLPFGPNPQAWHINAHEFLDWDLYRSRYQQEIHRLTVKNQDWRLDAMFNSNLNSYNNYHMAEEYEDLIPRSQHLPSFTPLFDRRR